MKDKIKYIRIKFIGTLIWGIGWGLFMGDLIAWWVGCLSSIWMWLIAMIFWKTYETDFGTKKFGWRDGKKRKQ